MNQWLQNRLQERTTWTGIFQLVPVLTGYVIAPEYIDIFVSFGMVLGAGHKILTKG